MEVTEEKMPKRAVADFYVPMAIAGIYLLAHILTANNYGYFRDALYYLACAQHLDWGYVDQPPLIVLVAWITRHTIGTSLHAILLWPALAGVVRILLTAEFARALGARRFGMGFAALLAATPGVYMVIDHQFAMNAFEPLFWTGCGYALLRMIQSDDPRWWVAFGAIAGLGLENKYSMGFFAGALLVGLLLTPQRKFFFTPWLLAGGAIALLLFLPNLLWNISHHWPFLELMHNIRASGRDVVLGPVAYLAQQVLIIGPHNAIFWIWGLWFYFFSPAAKSLRMFGWAFVAIIGFFMAAHGKNYYSAPAYPMMLAAGAVGLELWLNSARLENRRKLRGALKPIAAVWVVAGVLLMLPVVLPVLPIEEYLRYQARLPFPIPQSEKEHQSAPLPQHYADEFGWQEMVAAVAQVYHSLPPEEQAKTAIFAQNYGQAGAIDFWGPQYGLPRAICTHQNYFLWGPRNYTGEIVIRLGVKAEDARDSYASVVEAAKLTNPYALFFETRPILLCRGRKANLQTDWPNLKNWD